MKEEGEASNTTTHYRKGFLPNVEKPLFFLQSRANEQEATHCFGTRPVR